MKKFLSLVLSVVIVLSVTAGVNFSAQAAVTTLLWPVYDSKGNAYRNLNSHNADNTSGHQGIDINAPAGAIWYAPCNAVVDTVYTGCKTNAKGNHANCSPNHGRYTMNGKKVCNNGFGNGVMLKFSAGGSTYYIHCAHMNTVSSSLKEGQSISQGTFLGTVGDRGFSYGAHAHFQIVKGNNKWAKNTCCNDPTHSHCTFNYKYNASSSSQKNPSVSVKGASSITNSSARIDFTTNNPSGLTIRTVGVQIRKKGSSSWLVSKSEGVDPNYVNHTSIKMWWTIGKGKELNVALSPGTTYEYRAYAVYNGNNYYSPMSTFTTTGSHNHSWGSGTVVQSPTCYAPGFRKYTCSGCGAIKTESINKTSHNFVLDSKGNSNCLNPGKKTYICTTCGYTKTEDIPAKEHKFSEWKTYKEATCEEAGEQRRMCTVCGFEETKVIPTTEHNFEDGYCTICGAEENEDFDDEYEDDYEEPIPPARANIKKLQSKKKTVIVQWNTISDARGYQVQLATDKKFRKNKKSYSIGNQKASKKTVKKLKAKKKYFVRVRAYKVVDGEKIYGNWSKIRNIKTK